MAEGGHFTPVLHHLLRELVSPSRPLVLASHPLHFDVMVLFYEASARLACEPERSRIGGSIMVLAYMQSLNQVSRQTV
jgi:hypothetical protein